jgi:hypothetical protein
VPPAEGIALSQQPRRNEDRFYRYPMNRVVAILDYEAHVDAALEALAAAGINTTRVNVLSGTDGVHLLDRAGLRHGLRARLLRLAQRTAYEDDALRLHEQALQDGHHIVYVPVRSRDEADRVAGLLREAGGYHLLYFRRWSVEKPQGPGGGQLS